MEIISDLSLRSQILAAWNKYVYFTEDKIDLLLWPSFIMSIRMSRFTSSWGNLSSSICLYRAILHIFMFYLERTALHRAPTLGCCSTSVWNSVWNASLSPVKTSSKVVRSRTVFVLEQTVPECDARCGISASLCGRLCGATALRREQLPGASR